MKLFYTTTNGIQPEKPIRKSLRKIVPLVAIALVPIQLLAYSPASYAIPQQATVTHLNPTSGSNVPSLRESLNQRPFAVHPNQVIGLRTENGIPQQSMIVPARSQANLRFNSPASPLVQLSNRESQTEYLFPCAVQGGSAIVGWRALPRSSRGCSTFTVRTSTRGPVSEHDVTAPLVAMDKQSYPPISSSLILYCGTLEESGPGWGFTASEGDPNPCRQAEAECLATGTGNPCSVSTVGSFPLDDPDIIATIQCPNALPFTNRSSAEAMVANGLPELKRLARFTQTGTCVIDAYYPGDVVVAPADDTLTLVEIQTVGNSIQVEALVGDVTVVSADRPRGLLLSEGSKYQSGESQVTPLDCPSTLNSDPIQTFLNPQVWEDPHDAAANQDTIKTLNNYEAEFCQNAVGRPQEPSRPVIRFPFPFPDSHSRPRPEPEPSPNQGGEG